MKFDYINTLRLEFSGLTCSIERFFHLYLTNIQFIIHRLLTDSQVSAQALRMNPAVERSRYHRPVDYQSLIVPFVTMGKGQMHTSVAATS